MVRERLVARQGHVRVAVRERQHRLPRRLARLRARVEIHPHPLQGSRRRVVEGEIIYLPTLGGFLVLCLPDAHAELLVGVLSIPDVSQVLMDLARPEKLVRRRERRQRSSGALGYQHAVPGLQRYERVVLHPAELVLLRLLGRIPPHDPRHHVGRKALQAGVILVRDERLFGLRQRIHPDQIGAAIDGELETAREDPHRETWEIHFEAPAVGLHAAAGCLERRVGATDLLGFARQRRHLGAALAGNFKRRVMEGVPAVLGHHLRCQWDACGRQRPDMIAGHPAQAAHHVILRGQILTECGPLAALLPDRQVTNHGLAILNGVPRPHLAPSLARPRDDEQVLLNGGRETLGRFVLRQVAVQ